MYTPLDSHRYEHLWIITVRRLRFSTRALASFITRHPPALFLIVHLFNLCNKLNTVSARRKILFFSRKNLLFGCLASLKRVRSPPLLASYGDTSNSPKMHWWHSWTAFFFFKKKKKDWVKRNRFKTVCRFASDKKSNR